MLENYLNHLLFLKVNRKLEEATNNISFSNVFGNLLVTKNIIFRQMHQCESL